jgi:hypothetical protein
VSVITPNAAIADRWTCAREAKILRRPLEQFLRSRGLPLAVQAQVQVLEDVARVGTYFLEAAYAAYAKDHWEALPLLPRQASLLAKSAFALAGAVCELIGTPQHAQLAAAEVVTGFFTPRYGSRLAARVSVEGMVWCALRSPHGLLDQLLESIAVLSVPAITENNESCVQAASEKLAERIAAINP